MEIVDLGRLGRIKDRLSGRTEDVLVSWACEYLDVVGLVRDVEFQLLQVREGGFTHQVPHARLAVRVLSSGSGQHQAVVLDRYHAARAVRYSSLIGLSATPAKAGVGIPRTEGIVEQRGIATSRDPIATEVLVRLRTLRIVIAGVTAPALTLLVDSQSIPVLIRYAEFRIRLTLASPTISCKQPRRWIELGRNYSEEQPTQSSFHFYFEYLIIKI